MLALEAVNLGDNMLRCRFQGAKKVSPLFIPKLLTNLAAGHISIKFGLKVRSHRLAGTEILMNHV